MIQKRYNPYLYWNSMAIPILRQAIRLLETLAREPSDSTRQLARDLGIATTSCHRILHTFQQAQWVQRRDDGTYHLGLGLLAPLRQILQVQRFVEQLAPRTHALARETGLTVTVSLRDGADAVVVDAATPPRRFCLAVPAGMRLPVLVGAVGACLLSASPKRVVDRLAARMPPAFWRTHDPAAIAERIAHVRRAGFCLDPGDTHPEIAAIAAPLRSPVGVVAAIALLGLPREFSPRAARRFRAPLLRVVQSCQQEAGLAEALAATP